MCVMPTLHLSLSLLCGGDRLMITITHSPLELPCDVCYAHSAPISVSPLSRPSYMFEAHPTLNPLRLSAVESPCSDVGVRRILCHLFDPSVSPLLSRPVSLAVAVLCILWLSPSLCCRAALHTSLPCRLLHPCPLRCWTVLRLDVHDAHLTGRLFSLPSLPLCCWVILSCEKTDA
jgi:hypothetical protein